MDEGLTQKIPGFRNLPVTKALEIDLDGPLRLLHGADKQKPLRIGKPHTGKLQAESVQDLERTLRKGRRFFSDLNQTDIVLISLPALEIGIPGHGITASLHILSPSSNAGLIPIINADTARQSKLQKDCILPGTQGNLRIVVEPGRIMAVQQIKLVLADNRRKLI